MTYKVYISEDGTVQQNGRTVAYITESTHGHFSVYILKQDDGAIEIARFKNYRPNMTARSWIKFMLSKKTPAQIVKLCANKPPLEVARRLGFVSPAARVAELVDGRVDRSSKFLTGAVNKNNHNHH